MNPDPFAEWFSNESNPKNDSSENKVINQNEDPFAEWFEDKPTQIKSKSSFFDVLSQSINDVMKNSKVSDYEKTLSKALIEGISQAGRMVSPLQDEPEILQKQTQNLNKLLPTSDTFAQNALRRGVKEIPSTLILPGSKVQQLPRVIATGFIGEGAKELGAPEWAQAALEITAYLGPDVTKKLLEKGSNGEIIKRAKELGLIDKQIAPLLNSDFKIKWLSKISPRGTSTQEILSDSKKGLEQAYEKIAGSENAKTLISKEVQDSLLKDISKKLYKMPSSVSNVIKEDFQKFLNGPDNGESLINFYANINHHFRGNTKQLGKLKDPIKKALNQINPQLGKDFELINDLYSKYHKIYKNLKPDLTHKIISGLEAGGALASLVTGNYGYLSKIIGEKSARILAKQMLLNPKFQQLSLKSLDAAKNNKLPIARELIKEFSRNVRSTSPQLADQLEDMDDKEVQDFFSFIKKNQVSEKS